MDGEPVVLLVVLCWSGRVRHLASSKLPLSMEVGQPWEKSAGPIRRFCTGNLEPMALQLTDDFTPVAVTFQGEDAKSCRSI